VSLEKADALVIRQVDFSESSRVVTFFSREFGRFSALAKGAKRLKGPFEAALDLLSECRVVFIRKAAGTLNLLTEARLVTRFQPVQADPKSGLSRLYGGYYVAELLSGLTEEFDPAPEIYDLANQTLKSLSCVESLPASVLIHFEVSLLQLIGLFPNLFDCSVCGAAVHRDGQFAHWVSQGGLLCAGCRQEEYAGTSISAGSVEILRQLTQATPDLAGRLGLSPQQRQECHRLAVSAITHALGRRPSTLRYVQI
jgi:DNA repair protein RecO (recombination protein O)